MGFYFRVFANSSQPAKLSAIQRWLRQCKSAGVLDSPEHAINSTNENKVEPKINLNNSHWEQVAIHYKPGKLPILADCDRDGGKDGLVKTEVNEFLELIGPVGRSKNKRFVAEHLKATKMVVACQLPADIDDDGSQVTAEFLNYFIQYRGGMGQLDGSGFYYDGKYIFKTP